MKMSYVGLLVLSLAIVGCRSDAAPLNLPSHFLLEGKAVGVVGSWTTDCTLYLIVELESETLRTGTHVEYLGTMGGHVFREINQEDGSGVGFFADSHAQIRATLVFPDQVIIEAINIPRDTDAPRSRFWEEVERFDGILGIDEMISGSWVCAPLDVHYGGIDDFFISVDGSWFTTTID